MRWVTQERLQVDRLASAWLIRRFVDPEAVFGFVPRGIEATAVTDGTPFHMRGRSWRTVTTSPPSRPYSSTRG